MWGEPTTLTVALNGWPLFASVTKPVMTCVGAGVRYKSAVVVVPAITTYGPPLVGK